MKRIIRITALLLVLAMMAPAVAAATGEEIQPRASLYLQSFSVYMTMNEKVNVGFRVYGTGFMADIGVTEIVLQCSANGSTGWTDVATYYYTDTQYANKMMAHNKLYLDSSVPYEDGISGYYYRALVTVYAGDGTNGDSRQVYTAAKRFIP